MYRILYMNDEQDLANYRSVNEALGALHAKFPNLVFSNSAIGTWIWKAEEDSDNIDRAVARIEWERPIQ